MATSPRLTDGGLRRGRSVDGYRRYGRMNLMSELLIQAFEKASVLDPETQETIALSILRELELPVIEA